ncbi:hypothetical protein [Amycolatopsis jiangsuensis]|uniref:Uncharacterized protein n=1 Tax=Amycolatopsis jiangsuensis TaxID=1181879 RepID=A0A840IYN5_9PSEU|nr:hypothetical protein [Amycolatopsis jiangsuensis]MBB4686525.1 hypothetical protein [Amycolatopsis jiangsuensis]
MISHPVMDTVVAELGDKVILGLARAARHGKREYSVYREEHPDWVAINTPRTIACLLHDWMWSEVDRQFADLDHIHLIDDNVKREILVQVSSAERLHYRVRLKRHHLDGRTSSYRTQNVIDFESQGATDSFPGFDECRLEAGYEWDRETRSMGPGVLTLRDGQDNVIWTYQLPDEPSGEAGGVVAYPNVPGPTLPTVDVADGAAGGRQPTGSDEE